jgi:TP53 regulating kinase-like protein
MSQSLETKADAKKKRKSKLGKLSNSVNVELKDSCLIKQGAEARVYKIDFKNCATIVKERFAKQYRHPELDRKLIRQRLTTEVKCMQKVQKAGVDVPNLIQVDEERHRIFMEFVDGQTVRDFLLRLDLSPDDSSQQRALALAELMGRTIALVHASGVIHGDLTTSNMMLRNARPNNAGLNAMDTSSSNQRSDNSEKKSDSKSSSDGFCLVVIDFGLSFIAQGLEDRAVDLYVLEKAFLSTHPKSEKMFEKVLEGYGNCASKGLQAKQILAQLDEVRKRGRKRDMTG